MSESYKYPNDKSSISVIDIITIKDKTNNKILLKKRGNNIKKDGSNEE